MSASSHLSELVGTTKILAGALADDPRRALANATLYLDMAGHVVIAWMWLRQATAAASKLADRSGDADFLKGKLLACRYFYAYELPKTRTQRALLGSLDETTLTMQPEWF